MLSVTMKTDKTVLGCIFISVGGRDILSAPVCVRWHTGRFDSAHTDLYLMGVKKLYNWKISLH